MLPFWKILNEDIRDPPHYSWYLNNTTRVDCVEPVYLRQCAGMLKDCTIGGEGGASLNKKRGGEGRERQWMKLAHQFTAL